MSELYFLITVTSREILMPLINIFKSCSVSTQCVTLGRGTAVNEILDILGLESSEKAISFSFVTQSIWKNAKKQLERNLNIDIPGRGIAFTVPVSSVAGSRELKYITDGLDFEKGDESELKDTKNELIVIVCNQGYSESVMDAAREGGAGGGTVIHAKGTGASNTEKFFGISLAREKDMIFIVSDKRGKNRIMECVMQSAGVSTRAGAIAFSLPVTDTAGLRLISDEE